MRRTAWMGLMFLFLVVSAFARQAEVSLALRGLDPVELVAGREVAGREELAVVRGHYRYLFASTESRAAFNASPERYSIQFGGACQRMGPLGGLGSPDRFHLHDGRIYIFASDSCRNSFKKDPVRHVDRDDPLPEGTAEEVQRGEALVQRMLAGLGGADKVDSVASYRATVKRVVQGKDGSVEGTLGLTAAFPDRFRRDETWAPWTGTHVAAPGGGFITSGEEWWPSDESVQAYLVRELHRMPLALLKARREPGFRAVAAGRGRVGETEVEVLRAGVRGATTTLSVDPATGRVLEVTYPGRTDDGIGQVTKRFSDFRTVDGGLVLPFREEILYNGKPASTPVDRYDSIAVNSRIDPSLFQPPG